MRTDRWRPVGSTQGGGVGPKLGWLAHWRPGNVGCPAQAKGYLNPIFNRPMCKPPLVGADKSDR